MAVLAVLANMIISAQSSTDDGILIVHFDESRLWTKPLRSCVI